MKKGFIKSAPKRGSDEDDYENPKSTASMKLGVAYNVFDGEELLLDSIKSIKPNVEYVAVVYQLVSNFGNPGHPKLEQRLKHLVKLGLVDELHRYEPKMFTDDEKAQLCSPVSKELGGPPSMVSNQFFNELTKREIGRKMCAAKGCTHFMSMDTDEFYKVDELAYAKRKVLANDLDGTACKMRFYFKEPNYEMLPFDEFNQVPLIYKIKEGCPLLLAHPYPCVVDPTRRVAGVTRFYEFQRDEVEMHHFSFVRADMSSKMLNVSNRDNHDGAVQYVHPPRLHQFSAAKYPLWTEPLKYLCPRDKPLHLTGSCENSSTGHQKLASFIRIRGGAKCSNLSPGCQTSLRLICRGLMTCDDAMPDAIGKPQDSVSQTAVQLWWSGLEGSENVTVNNNLPRGLPAPPATGLGHPQRPRSKIQG